MALNKKCESAAAFEAPGAFLHKCMRFSQRWRVLRWSLNSHGRLEPLLLTPCGLQEKLPQPQPQAWDICTFGQYLAPHLFWDTVSPLCVGQASI